MAERLGGDTLIIIPACNEHINVAAVVREACEVACNVLVVDDASSDDTAYLAQRSGAQVLKHFKRQGQGGAVWSGLLHARAEGYKYVITMDADGAHMSSDAIAIQSRLAAGSDVVIGSRFLDRSRNAEMPSPKVAANRFGTALLNKVLLREFTDVASGMRGLAGRALKLDFTVRDFGFAFEVLAQAVDRKLELAEVPIGVRYDASEPHFTSQREILEFFRFFLGLCRARQIEPGGARELESLLKSGCAVVVGLDDKDYYFHAVSPGWYLVQQQEHWFKLNGEQTDVARVDLRIS